MHFFEFEYINYTGLAVNKMYENFQDAILRFPADIIP
jgi:hypothetical protein